jgi:acetyl-CoA C-acetyltransferase
MELSYDLGVVAVKEAIKRAGITPDMVDETVLGCILQAGQGQGVARQVAIKSGIPVEKPAYTINMICGSGLRAVQIAAQQIISGESDVVVAGGRGGHSQVILPWGLHSEAIIKPVTLPNGKIAKSYKEFKK